MTRLAQDLYIDHIRNESQRFRVALADCDLEARVPSCPDWNAADLLWHLGADVQAFWAWIVENRPADREAYPKPVRPDSPAGLFDAFDAGSSRLLAALESVDPNEHAWTWSTDQTVGFIGRRQAHEALIHRLDAELTTGVVTDLDPALAADGVQECLAVMYGCPPWGTFTPGDGLLRLDLTDAGDSVWVRLGRFTGTDPDDGRSYDDPDIGVVADPGAEPDTVVAAAAGPMDAWLWHRGDADVTVTGDRSVYDRFAALVTSPTD